MSPSSSAIHVASGNYRGSTGTQEPAGSSGDRSFLSVVGRTAWIDTLRRRTRRETRLVACFGEWVGYGVCR